MEKMRRSRLPQETAKNASKLHQKVGMLLVELFPRYAVRQEYSVNLINPSFLSKREKFDWVVLGLNIVVEIHGEQHYSPVCFGGIVKEKAKRELRKRKEKDWEKEQAALSANWLYIVVKFDEKGITTEELSSKIIEAEKKCPFLQKETGNIKPIKIQNKGFGKQQSKLPKSKKGWPKSKEGWPKPKNGYNWPKQRIENNDNKIKNKK